MKRLLYVCWVALLCAACSDTDSVTPTIDWENPTSEAVEALVSSREGATYDTNTVTHMLCSGLFIGQGVEDENETIELYFDRSGVVYTGNYAMNWDYDETTRSIITTSAWGYTPDQAPQALEIGYLDDKHMIVKGALYTNTIAPDRYWVVSFDAEQGKRFVAEHNIGQWEWFDPMPQRQFEELIAECTPEKVDDAFIKKMLTERVWWMTWPYSHNIDQGTWECTSHLDGCILTFTTIFTADKNYYGDATENDYDPTIPEAHSLCGPYQYEYDAATNQIKGMVATNDGSKICSATVVGHNDRYVVLRGMLPASYLKFGSHYDQMYLVVDLERVSFESFYNTYGQP